MAGPHDWDTQGIPYGYATCRLCGVTRAAADGFDNVEDCAAAAYKAHPPTTNVTTPQTTPQPATRSLNIFDRPFRWSGS